MKKKLYVLIIMLLLVVGCGTKEKNHAEISSLKTVSKIKELLYVDPIEKKVDSIMTDMTIEEKIGQMFILCTRYSKDKTLLSVMDKYPFGGVILFKENISTYDKTKDFIDNLKNKSKIPLIVSMDQEGGGVQRLWYLKDVKATNIPYMYELGSTGDKELAYEVGKVIAEEVRTLGVNVVHAPVLDIFSNPNNDFIGKRCFGSDSDTVSNMALSFSKGLEDNGVIATYKHFPGHGDTKTDSHVALPIINKSYDDIKNLELIPFQNAIDSGAKIIMVGHQALPQITGNNESASLSKKIITDILKKDMGYNGLVITDGLDMGALTQKYSSDEIALKAIDAGVDILLMSTNYESALKAIKENVSEERINESVRKILIFKYTYLDQDNSLDKSYLGSKEHKEVISKIKR